MAVSNRDYQLINDFMALQISYNALVKETDLIKRQFSAFTASSAEKEIEQGREVSRLKELLSRVKSYEAPSTTLKRKKKELSALPE